MSSSYRLAAGLVALAAFAACVPAANWLILNVGAVCAPQAPCLIPVGFGQMAPSGVVMIGIALVLRDIVHRTLGPWPALAAILAGAGLSAIFSPPQLVLGSVAAFLVSELADFAVYSRLAQRRFLLAVALSSVVGLVVDSAAFLWIAFGSLEYLPGQVLGKLWAVLACLPLALAARRLGVAQSRASAAKQLSIT